MACSRVNFTFTFTSSLKYEPRRAKPAIFTYKYPLGKETFNFEQKQFRSPPPLKLCHIRKSPRASRRAQCTACGPRDLSCPSLVIRSPKTALPWTRFIHSSLFPDMYAFATCMERRVCQFGLLWPACLQFASQTDGGQRTVPAATSRRRFCKQTLPDFCNVHQDAFTAQRDLVAFN